MVSFCGLPSFFLSFSFVLLSPFSNFIGAQDQDYDYPIATLSKRWTNNATASDFPRHRDGSIVQAILLRAKEANSPAFACGFYCNGNCNSYLFAVLIVQVDDRIGSIASGIPQVVWSANRNNPVKIGATLDLTSEGDLVLKDADGMIAWSTNASGKSVVGLNLTYLGNLVLFDKDTEIVWQSFDHPTDSLVLGQKLRVGQRLMPSVSETNWTIDSIITLSVNGDGLFAQVETDPPQIYLTLSGQNLNASIEFSYVELVNGSLSWFSNSTLNMSLISVPQASSAQYVKLGSDGHLRMYDRFYGFEKELFEAYLDNCDYPTVCGQYGICSNGQCSCPASSGETSYFRQVDDKQLHLGCSENVPLSCRASQQQSLLELENVTYFSFTPDLKDIDVSSCKEACAKNCSCKAAIFNYESNRTDGYCYLPTQVFSLMNVADKMSPYNYATFLKVQNLPIEAPHTPVDNHMSSRLPTILGSSLGALFAVIIFIVAIVLLIQKRDDNQAEEDYLDQALGMLNRFTYDNLKTITNEFSRKLGEGGFGSVFEGTLSDGTKIAVKRLDGFGHVKKSFLAEVETIGSIHHVNLVRLVGFCAEKSHRLLIYEHMSNGSLDRWIFHKSNECVLNWQQRKKIILDIAKGLNYLHEDCRQKIVHLDIKPQNILLDGNFNAKVADFGLSKLIDKDQSQIVTTMRGTPGYLAPEWLSATITEKVDVYSFGVVILEILCGRKIFDRSLDEEDMYLLSLFKKKVEEEQLLDIVDKSSDDMQLNGPNAVNMMRIAAWCLQGDYIKRPPMSMVIKALEGIVKVQEDLNYDFSAQPSTSGATRFDPMDVEFTATATLLPSILSGPR